MSSRGGVTPLKVRLRRLLVILPWLAERGSASLTEMSERFQISEKELVADLEQAAMCGLPPFVDELVDLYIDDDGVAHIDVPRFFTRPLRLTAPEGFSLLMAGRTALALPGGDSAGPLVRALAKLEALLGADGMALDLAQPELTGDLVDAVDNLAEVHLEYLSASSDEVSERNVMPRAVFADRGRWYLLADDERSGEQRTFRIDRVLSCMRTGAHGEPRDVQIPGGDEWFDGAPALPVVTLRLPAADRWVIERFPVRQVLEDGEVLQIELVVASEAWLRALLLRLGPAAEVLSPPEWRDLAARSAAALLAARYAAD